MYRNSLIPLELGHISQPFLIWLVRMELAVYKVFSSILGILCPPGAAMIIVFHRGTYIFAPADTQYPLVINMDTMVVAKIVIEPSISLIRAFCMELFDLAS